MLTREQIRAGIEESRARLDTAITRADELRALESMTPEQETEFDTVVADLNYHAERLQALTARAGSISISLEQPHELTGEEREESRANYRTIGERFAEVEGLRTISKGQTINMDVGSGFFGEAGPAGQRALVTEAGLPADYLPVQRLPGIRRPLDTFGSLRDVLTVMQINDGGGIQYFRENVFTNSAAEVAEATATTGTSGLKPESGITFTQETANVSIIAHWIPITKQTLMNAPELRSYIEGRLIDGLRLREDNELLNGDGVAPNIEGLLNVTGIQVLDAAYFTANPVADAGTDNENFNRVLRAKTLAATVGRARANFTVLNPIDHEVFMTSTDANQQYFGAGPFAAGLVPTLWGMPVISNENIAEGTALVGDGREAAILDRMAANVQAGWVNDDFIRNMIRLLAEEAVGLAVFRPAAFVEVALA